MAQETADQILNSIDIDQLGGERQAAEGNAPLLLENVDSAVLVLDGHLDVFAVSFSEDGRIDRRYSLYRAHQGDLVVGLPSGRLDEAGPRYFIEAVGSVGTVVLDKIKTSVMQAVPEAVLAGMLDRLTEGHLYSFEHSRPARTTTVMGVGDHSELHRAIAAFGTGHMPVWLRAGNDLLMYGDAALNATCLPVTSSAWAEAADSQQVSCLGSADLVADGSWYTALSGFLTVCQDMYAVRIAEADELVRSQLTRTREVEGKALEDALLGMASTIRPSRFPAEMFGDVHDPLHRAFLIVARDLEIEGSETPLSLRAGVGVSPIDALALTYRVRTRPVLLRDRWWKSDNGPLIGYLEADNSPVALLPVAGGGYRILDPQQGTDQRVTAAIAADVLVEAVMLYRPLPETVAGIGGLIRFIMPKIRMDLRRIALMGVLGGMIAAFTPVMTGQLIEKVLPRSDMFQHAQIIIALVCASFGAAVFEAVKSFALLRIESQADLSLQSSIFDRTLRLPARFFRGYTVGDLTDRVLGVQTIRQTLTGTTLQSLLSVLFSCFSLILLFFYNWKLALVAVAMVLVAILVTVYLGIRQLEHERERIRHQGRAEGFILQMLTGINKLRAAAAEKRAYARWAKFFTEQKGRFVQAQRFANYQDLFQSVFPALATGVIFIAASVFIEDAANQLALDALVAKGGEEPEEIMSTGDFIAFNTAFGQFLLAMTALSTALTRSLAVIPLYERMRPIIEAEPEVKAENLLVETLQGGIEISHLGFRYAEGAPLVLDDLSLTIQPNEYVAIVGSSGSGKSTLVRLMLGFEKPESGEILFDGIPQKSMDISGLRRQMQVVLQHGKLTNGSIFTNIVGSTTLTQDDAWQAARLAGFDKDIEALPMGMHTVITEGVNTLSGGQRQRLMIARALVQRPAILLLDEPTSALDNTTQDIVMTSLRELNATRILIAHRLSTVRHVDRILVMDRGKLVQTGSYDDLISKPGLFADMAKRQSL